MAGLNGSALDVAGQVAKQQARLQQVTAAAGMAVYAHLVAQLYSRLETTNASEPSADQLRQAALRSQRAAAYYAESLGLCNVSDKVDDSTEES
jgi:hypothetical protein